MYVKYINYKEVIEAPTNKDGICNYNLDVERMIADGYKLFIPAEIPQTNRMYHIEYIENIDNIAEIIAYDETQEEANARELKQAKENKIEENDTKRDEMLNQGVVYQNILFDSDTDQKVNLLAIISTMEEGQTIIWFGKDNIPLECTKEDLIIIGTSITQLHSYCWNKNAAIKQAIKEAETIAEVEAVEIDYILPEESEEE